MATIQNNRKRNRSVDADFRSQSKYFVNQRMVDSLDQKYMKKIFDKTVGILFQGAKNNSNNNQSSECKNEKFKSIRLDGEGNVKFMDGSAGNTDKIRCTSCDRSSMIESECSNCNLNLCEFCGVSCANCMEAHICKHCVHLFESNVNRAAAFAKCLRESEEIISFLRIMARIMMHNNQSNQSLAEELEQHLITSNEILIRDLQQSSSENLQPQKRQRKQSTKKAKRAPPINMSFTQPQTSSTTSNDSNILLNYQQSVGQAQYRPAPFGYPFGNIPQMQSQNTQLPFPFPFNPFYQQMWPSPMSSQQYPSFGQFRPTTSALDDWMSMSFYRNQNIPQPDRVTPDTYSSRSQYGLTESEPRYDRTQSQIGLAETSSLGAVPEVTLPRGYERVAMSAFQIYERPPTDDATGTLEQSANVTDQKSTISNSDSPHSSQSANEESNENAVNIICDRIGVKKAFDPSSVIDEKYDFSCVICQEKKKNTVLLPCRHLCVCEKCCENIDLCPLCRKAFDEPMTVFT